MQTTEWQHGFKSCAQALEAMHKVMSEKDQDQESGQHKIPKPADRREQVATIRCAMEHSLTKREAKKGKKGKGRRAKREAKKAKMPTSKAERKAV